MMTSLENEYLSILSELDFLEKEYKKLFVSSGNETLLQRELETYKKETDLYRQQLLANVKNVNMFIALAQKNVVGVKNAMEPLPYNAVKLSQLMAKYNAAFNSKAYAEELYREATGQLLYLQNELGEIDSAVHEKERQISNISFSADISKKKQIEKIRNDVENILTSERVSKFLQQVLNCNYFFENKYYREKVSNYIPIGLIDYSFPTSGYDASYLCDRISKQDQTIRMNKELDVNKGNCIGIACYASQESEVLVGIQRFILNVLLYSKDFVDDILFVDPIRGTSFGTGILVPVCGKDGSILRNVPTSRAEIIQSLNDIIESISSGKTSKRKVIFLNSVSTEYYGTDGIDLIRKICSNASYYGITIILSNIEYDEESRVPDKKSFAELASFFSMSIVGDGSSWKVEQDRQKSNFRWPGNRMALTAEEIDSILTKQVKEVVDINNDYYDRVGFLNISSIEKGNRKIENLPLGVDEEGIISRIDMENTNFATFICGASRSGKSVLLHTLVSDIICNYHPDDVEVWLIDFKMTEFSNYAKHTPPHVRYILLDESPELVYDIVDRLTEILQKRQQIFMGNWSKLSEVPTTRYMPAMIVMIDEFHVMSDILDKADLAGKGDYKEKMQHLLAMGAAFGMKFIFSSQGFTSGTRALSEYSKKQIQQRIALKTEYQEIVNTLDLQVKSENDKKLMVELQPHHALLRQPVDSNGNYIHKSKVLYISDMNKLYEQIDRMIEKYRPVARFEPDNLESYIDKRCMVIDGLRYYSFDEKWDEIKEDVDKSNDIDSKYFALGVPKKMARVQLSYLYKGFSENIFILGGIPEKEAISSVIVSISRCIEKQYGTVKCIGHSRNAIFSEINSKRHLGRRSIMISDIEESAQEIHEIRKNIENNIESDEIIFVLGYELLYQEYEAFGDKIAFAPKKKTRGQGLDLMSQMDLNITEVRPEQEEIVGERINALDDIEFVLKNGSRYGYHFVFQFGTYGDVKNSSVKMDWFKHKIIFRCSNEDINNVLSLREARNMSTLSEHCFRYFDGMDSTSFKPMLHPGISIDGYIIENGQVVKETVSEEDYLL